MTQQQTSNVVDLARHQRPRLRSGSSYRLLDVLPIPEADQVMLIIGHLVPAQEHDPPGDAPMDEAIERDGLRLDRASRRVWTDGREARLTYLEYELLEHLLANPGRVFTRVQLRNTVWLGATEVTTRTVDVHVHRIRRKLGRHAAHLVTVRRVGYTYRPSERQAP